MLDAAGPIRMQSGLKNRVAAGMVPEMKYLDRLAGFIDPVIDQDGRVNELADSGAAGHRVPDIGKRLQQADVTQKFLPEAFRRSREVRPGVIEDFFEVR